jgi:hypothetical protein
MAQSQKPANVFISYARSDARRVEAIVKSLVASGLLTEQDRILKEEDLPPKHGYLRQEVKRQIQSASKVIVVWGPASATSQWVNYEVGLADALGKPIIVVLSTSEELALPASLQNVQVVRVASDG